MNRKSICSILVALLLALNLLSPGIAAAAERIETTSGTLIEKVSGTISDGDSLYWEFELQDDARITFEFTDESYGYYELVVYDNDSEYVVYEQRDQFISYDYVTHEAELPRGSYTAALYENDDWDLDYEFSATYEYLMSEENPYYYLEREEMYLSPGITEQLKVLVQPENAIVGEVLWASDNSEVATVDAQGRVTGHTAGNAVISALIGDEMLFCDITVGAPEYSSLNYKEASLYVSEALKLDIKVTPESYGLGGLQWISSNPDVAAVDSKGLVTAKAAGSAVITAKIGDVERSCTITVKPMGISAKTATVYVKKTKTLKINGGTGSTKWTTSKKSVATVTSKGVVKGIKPGTATIKGKKNGKTFSCKVTVKWAPETGITSSKDYSVPKGTYGNDTKKFTLSGKSTVTLKATNTSDDLEWYEDDLAYIVLDSASGKEYYSVFLDPGESIKKTLTLNAGSYELYYDVDNGCDIALSIKTSPQLSKTSMTVAKKYSRTLKAVAVVNGGTWSSTNKKVATVTSKGVVKGKKNGTCYIKYKMKNGKVLKCKVTVKNPVTYTVTGVSNVAIYNDCYIKFVNNTGKKVKYIKFNIKQYNKIGKRVYGPYSWYYMDDDIGPYSSIEQYWWVNDSARKCKVSITKVYFTDGTTWRP